jgi:hypothetical protein
MHDQAMASEQDFCIRSAEHSFFVSTTGARLKREKLYEQVCQAHSAMNELCLELHHLAAGGADKFRGALK